MRDYTKFFTLSETALFMASLLDCKYKDTVLEPSAGSGALVKAVRYRHPHSFIVAVELYQSWQLALYKEGANIVYAPQDFLTFNPELQFNYRKFDHCIANPPFGNENNIDDHFKKMCELTVEGGSIVALLPDDYVVTQNHERFPLRNWGSNKDGSVTPIKIVKFIN